jgi:glycerophosphoryl diester phosphodiesterase
MASSHPFVDAPRPLVFAHRGGSALAPENTFAAFDNGLSLGADGLELDVHLSSDGRPVVIHDPDLGRTTDAEGPVGARSSQQLSRVDAGFRFRRDGEFPFRGRGLGVPTLADVLARYPQARIIIELKGGSEVLARAALADVTRARATDRVCFGSAEDGGLRAIRALAPEAATSASRNEICRALARNWFGAGIAHPRFVAFQVPERSGRIRVVSPRFVRAAHRSGLVVQVWTVDEVADMRRLLAWGVDAIISDRPDVAVEVVREGTA